MKTVIATMDNLLQLQKMPKNTKIIAYKVFGVDEKGRGKPPLRRSFQSGGEVRYKLKKGYSHKQMRCSKNPREECGKGLHVATLDWCCDFWCVKQFGSKKNTQVWQVSFLSCNIGCVPVRPNWATGRAKPFGKFRVRKFTMVQRVDWRGNKYRARSK